MKKEVLMFINSSQAHINSGETLDECYQRSHEFCIKLSQYLDDVRPESENERQAIAFAKEQLALNDLAGAYETLEPFCSRYDFMYTFAKYTIAVWIMALVIIFFLLLC